jgi:hypothetical protein
MRLLAGVLEVLAFLAQWLSGSLRLGGDDDLVGSVLAGLEFCSGMSAIFLACH